MVLRAFAYKWRVEWCNVSCVTLPVNDRGVGAIVHKSVQPAGDAAPHSPPPTPGYGGASPYLCGDEEEVIVKSGVVCAAAIQLVLIARARLWVL